MAGRDLTLIPFLCVFGHTNLDFIMSLERFPEKNTSVDVVEKQRYFGGTGANVATVAASLGVPTALASYVGKDMPTEFRELMIAKGVDLRDLVEVDGYETPTVWIVSDRAHDQIAYVYQGPMRRMEEFELRMNAANEAQFIHIMTGRPEYYLRLMKECVRLGKNISFDPAQEIHHIWTEEAFRQAIGMCDMFFCNENELKTAMRYLEAKRPEDLLDHVDVLFNTIGSKGSRIYTEEGELEIPAVKPTKVIDTTGAGDAFRAGYFAGLYRNYSIKDSARFGAAAASFVIEASGSLTNIPEWPEVLERARSVL
ncbi:MAG TPA: carbohydrate kinase family protein [Methanomassiliicoccales archaeon]|jgi:sugar/nucleoside kinase (ribokinase family)